MSTETDNFIVAEAQLAIEQASLQLKDRRELIVAHHQGKTGQG